MSHPFGSIFPEEIISEKKRKPVKWQKEDSSSGVNRLWFFVCLLIFGLGILLARLFVLTMIEGSRYRKLAQENRTREIKIPAPRGIIYDRNGSALVRNIPYFISSAGEVYFEELPATASGEITESVAREYIFSDLFAHVVGYTGEVNSEEIKNQKLKIKSLPEAIPGSQKVGSDEIEYTLGDIVGKMGIEKSKDSLLRGQNGKQLVEVDALGKKIRVLGEIAPIAGGSITLSIDSNLQKIAAEQLMGKKGAIVAANSHTGEILLLYSSPVFDPNKFVKGQDVEKLLSDPDNPLFNRVISGTYPPGSTFKIITSTAALETGAITRETKIEDTGILQVGRFSFANWYFTQYGKKEGFLDIVGAIRRSNDIFFYKAGEMTGIDALSLWAKKMGVGKTLGIDIPGEETGLMPDPVWQKEVKNEDWYLGNTYHVAIGQGDILTTPLQVNAWTNVIANNGRLCKPYLVNIQNEACIDLSIKKETIDLVKEGMREACSQGGTGWPLFKFKVKSEKLKVDGVNFLETYEATASGSPLVEIPVACKTGTAEFGDPKGRTHAWFTVFAPIVNPQISVTVLIEAGGEGSSVAAPIAKKILEEWFNR